MSEEKPIARIWEYVAEQTARVQIKGAEPVFLPGGPSAFLVLHGWAATPESMRFVIRGVSEAGYTVLAPLLPGHGTSAEDMTCTGPLDWIAAAREGLRLLSNAYGSVHILGASMGGALGIQLAALEPARVRSLTTINAPVYLEWPEYGRQLMSGCPDELLESRQGPLCFGPEVEEITYPRRSRKSGVDVAAMAGLARAALPGVQAPLLALQSVRDPVVAPGNAETIVSGAGSASKRIDWLEQSLHASQLDLDRERIVQLALKAASVADAALS